MPEPLDFPWHSRTVWPKPPVPGLPEWQWDSAKWTIPYSVTTENPRCGRLVLVNDQTVGFIPHNGDRLKIAGRIYRVPAEGLPLSVDDVPAMTNAYVYAEFNNGALRLVASTTYRVTDGTTPGNVGVQIMNGDPNRSLVGMVWKLASNRFADNPQQRLVASWFNRQDKTLFFQIPDTPIPGQVGEVWLTLAMIETLVWSPFGYSSSGSITLYAIGQLAKDADSRMDVRVIVDGYTMVPFATYSFGWPTERAALTLGGPSNRVEGRHYFELQARAY